ncbi:MAG: arabinan endo-1,5-alpha-L-arabinosidase [Planctomycetota bacterium]|nr:arabinan endo-1,5-alpha-L-arabinosidase [Planctomycetota bacterium]
MRCVAGFVFAAFLATLGSAEERLHDPHIIAADGFFYIFSTGKGIPIRRSRDLRTWEQVGTVFSETPAWAKEHVPDAKNIWASDVTFFGDRYHLYYSVSTFGKNRSCIGLATNVTLDRANPKYQWKDEGLVIETRVGDPWNSIDACPVLDREGQPWLAVGSFWSGIKLLRLDPKTGKRADEELIPLAARPAPGAIEAPYIIWRDGFYYLFVSFDLCAKGADSTYRIMVGRSKLIQGPYQDREGREMKHGGGTQVLAGEGTVRGPGHNSILHLGDRHWLVCHYYDAADRGIAKLL